MHLPRSSAAILCAIVAAAGLTATARADVDIDAKAKAAVQSLVIVDVTVENENSSREDSGQGIVLSKDGVILVPGSLIDERYPKEWIKEIKIRLPGKNFLGVPATILGRTRNRVYMYLKTNAPIDTPVFDPGEMSQVKLGQSVFAAALMGSNGGYAMYAAKSDVRASLNLSHTLISTASFGLTRGNSPVYDAATGNFVGLTVPAMAESMLLREGGAGGAARRIELIDEDQSSGFLPIDEVKPLFKDIPSKPFDLRRPWLAVDGVTGLKEGVRILKKIDQPAAVLIGSVIPGECADKGGLKPGDIVLTVDGKQFSQNPVPEMMIMHFSRIIDELKPGDKITLGVLRDNAKVDVPIVLGESPKLGSEMAHTYSPKTGIVTRDLVFTDAYTRHISQDTKGVMIALVKQGSPAALGTTPLRSGLLITKVDEQPVENEKQFLELLSKTEEKPDLKEIVFEVIQPSGESQVCRVDMTK